MAGCCGGGSGADAVGAVAAASAANAIAASQEADALNLAIVNTANSNATIANNSADNGRVQPS